MQTEIFSEEESMRLINEMISKAKKSYVTKGLASMAWGAIIIICSLVTWANATYGFDPGFNIWLLTFFAIFPQIFFTIQEKKKRKFTPHNDNTTGYVWTAFGISIFMVSFYNAKFGTAESSTLFMILYAIPTFITGGIYHFKPMIIGGIFCWVASIISLFTPFTTDMLLMAASGLFAWLIPGIILWRRYQQIKRENV